jgi:hypothetical protein
MIEGLIRHDTEMRVEKNFVDSHGHTVILTLVGYTVRREGSRETGRAGLPHALWHSSPPTAAPRRSTATPRVSPLWAPSACSRQRQDWERHIHAHSTVHTGRWKSPHRTPR